MGEVRRKPGIAMLTTYYRPVLGGVETAAETLALWLAARGHPVHVLTTRTRRDCHEHERDGLLRITRWPRLGPRRAWNKWLAILPLAWAAWRLRNEVSLFFVVDFRAIGLAARLAGWLSGRPFMFQAETDGAFEVAAVRRAIERVLGTGTPAARLATWPMRRLYRGAALNICISRQIEREALAAGWPRDHVVYLPHPVDRNEFHPPESPEHRRALRVALGLPLDAVIVAFVGRLSREKGVLDLAQAWHALDGCRAHLVVVGPDMDGHPWNAGPEVRALLATSPLSSTAVGGLDHHQVAQYLQAADLAVLPSHFEAFGIAAAEAMSCGLPVIVTDVGGFRDYVRDGRNGLLVPPHNPEAIRRAMETLIDSSDHRAALGRAAHLDSALFDRDVVFSQCAEWITTVTAGDSRPR